MGNQIASDIDHSGEESNEGAQVLSAVDVSNSRDIPQRHRSRHSRHKHQRIYKSRVQLVPLSGSPKPVSSSLPNMPFERHLPETTRQTVYHLSPGHSCTADQLTEEEQVRLAQRIGLIHHLPRSTWDETSASAKKFRECCICMLDFEQDEPIRYLPCMHYYHLDCIDDWLIRSFTCPTCMEPVDAALLSAYDNQSVNAV